MIRVSITRNGIVTNSAVFAAQADADAWLSQQEALGIFGRPARWEVVQADGSVIGEDVTKAIATRTVVDFAAIPAVPATAAAAAVLDAAGAVVTPAVEALPAIPEVPAITHQEAQFAADYTVSQTDASSELWSAVRARRDILIAATDYLLMPDYNLSAALKPGIIAYRQALRDLPSTQTDPSNITWPTLPAVK